MSQFTFYTPEIANGEGKALLTSIEKSFGFVPNLFAYMAEAPSTIQAYLAMNEIFEKSSFSPAQQQIVLLAISVENQCEFCTVVHRALGKMNKSNQQTLDALNTNTKINDASDRVLITFTRKMVNQRGHMDQSDIQNFLKTGFNKQQILEIVLAVSIKTLSNYISHLTEPKPNGEFHKML